MPPETPSILWQVADHFGFPIAVCCLLAFYIGKRLRENTAEVGRNTRASALVVLAMQFAPQFHQHAKELYHESMRAAKERKEDLDDELGRDRP